MDIPFDLLYIIASFYTKPRMKLLDWIPENKLDWGTLLKNPNAIQMLEIVLQRYPYNISRWNLSENPNAIHLLEKYPDKIDWWHLSKNPNLLGAMHLLEKHKNYPDWGLISMNPNIFEIDTVQMKIELTEKAKNIDIYE